MYFSGDDAIPLFELIFPQKLPSFTSIWNKFKVTLFRIALIQAHYGISCYRSIALFYIE